MNIQGEYSSNSLKSEARFIEADARSIDRCAQILRPNEVAKDKEEWQTQIEKSADFLLYHLYQPANDLSFSPRFPDSHDPICMFFSETVPEISVSSYLKRLQLYSECSPSTFIHALIYLRRVEEADYRLAITPYTMHRLLDASILVAVKFLEEACHSNAYYSRVGGMGSVQEMNLLEFEFYGSWIIGRMFHGTSSTRWWRWGWKEQMVKTSK